MQMKWQSHTRSLIIEKIAEYGIEKVEDKING